MMNLLKLDLFSSEFYFSLGGEQYRKGTVQGIFLTFFSVAIVISYFIYLLNQLVNNQIDPKFRSQSFIVNNRIEVKLDSDLIGFLFNYNQTLTLDQLEQSSNKTYLVFYASFFYGDHKDIRVYDLDVIPCTNPQLKNYKCIDFSKIRNETLVIDNSKSLISSVQIYVYGCHDLDHIKKTIPNNCASQNQIDEAVNGEFGYVYLKMQVQQYNTTSKQMQVDYRRVDTFLLSNQFILTNIHAQKQETEVSSGLVFQSRQSYSSPIQYNIQNSNYDRQKSLESGLGPFNEMSIKMDEIVQQFQIQYPTLTEILALVNSIAIIVMVARFIGKLCSRNVISQDLFMLILRNLFQEKNEQIMKHNKLINHNDRLILDNLCNQQSENNDFLEKQNVNNIFIPKFPKFRDFIESSQNNNTIQSPQLYQQITLNTEEDKKEQKESQMTEIQSIRLTPREDFKLQDLLGSNRNKINTDQQDTSLKKQESHKLNFDINKSPIQKSQHFMNSQLCKKDFIFGSEANQNFANSATLKKKGSNSMAISQKLQAINNNSMNKAIQNLIFNFKQIFCFKKFILIFENRIFKRKEFKTSKGLDDNLIQGIQQEASKHLNIFNIYKDIIFMKKAIFMLLKSDQLAAIQLVGLTDDYLSQSNQIPKNLQEGNFCNLKNFLYSQDIYRKEKEIEPL